MRVYNTYITCCITPCWRGTAPEQNAYPFLRVPNKRPYSACIKRQHDVSHLCAPTCCVSTNAASNQSSASDPPLPNFPERRPSPRSDLLRRIASRGVWIFRRFAIRAPVFHARVYEVHDTRSKSSRDSIISGPTSALARSRSPRWEKQLEREKKKEKRHATYTIGHYSDTKHVSDTPYSENRMAMIFCTSSAISLSMMACIIKCARKPNGRSRSHHSHGLEQGHWGRKLKMPWRRMPLFEHGCDFAAIDIIDIWLFVNCAMTTEP